MSKTSKIILVTIIATLILLGLGYAAITNITLNIAGTASATADSGNFKVRFTENIEVSESAYVTATRTGDHTATIAVSGLTSAGQEVTATYEIKNESSDLSADLKVDTSNDNTEYFKISSKLADSSITANETTTVLVTVELTKTPIDEDVSANVGVELTAMPVQPGEEGTSSGMNDYSETPRTTNEYGFYFNEGYTAYDAEYDKYVTYVFKEEGYAYAYLDGVIIEYSPTNFITYELNKIIINEEFYFDVKDNGNILSNTDGEFILDTTFMDMFDIYAEKQLNEYGFYFGEVYSTHTILNNQLNNFVSYVFYEDGSAKMYDGENVLNSYSAGTVIYSEGKVDISSILGEDCVFTIEQNGKILGISGTGLSLDPNYVDRVIASKTLELNEYGFYYDYAYSANLDTLRLTTIFNEDGTAEEYLEGLLYAYRTGDEVVYEMNKITSGTNTFTVEENGTQLLIGSSPLDLDKDFMDEYNYYIGKKNEYGFYFGEPYSFMNSSDDTEPITTYIVYEDGSMDYYYNHELVRNYSAGTLIYSENTIDATSVDMGIFDIKSNGRIAKSSIGRVVALDRNFWERVASLNAE